MRVWGLCCVCGRGVLDCVVHSEACGCVWGCGLKVDPCGVVGSNVVACSFGLSELAR